MSDTRDKSGLSDDPASLKNGCHFHLRRRKSKLTWAKRKRWFVQHFNESPIAAVEMLFGGDESDLNWDYCLANSAMKLARRTGKRNLRPNELRVFIRKCYPRDPFEIREDARIAEEREKLTAFYKKQAQERSARVQTYKPAGGANQKQIATAEARKQSVARIATIERATERQIRQQEEQAQLHEETLRRLAFERKLAQLSHANFSGPQS